MKRRKPTINGTNQRMTFWESWAEEQQKPQKEIHPIKNKGIAVSMVILAIFTAMLLLAEVL